MKKTVQPAARDLSMLDHLAWHTLWREYCDHFATSDLDKAESPFNTMTQVLWERLIDPEGPIRGFVVEMHGQIIGFLHYTLHVHSWGTGFMCHCEDLFVTAEFRNSAAGATMLDTLLQKGHECGWDRIYGSTDADNIGARRLYGRFVPELDRRMFQLVLKDYGWDETGSEHTTKEQEEHNDAG